METETHSIRKNTIISLIISGISFLYPVLVFIYIARILHPEGMGRISFASSLTSYFVMFAGLGMPIYGLRTTSSCARSPKELSRLMAELLLIRIFTGTTAFLLFLLTSQFLASNDILLIYGISILAAIPDCSWLYKGMEDYISLGWISTTTRFAGMFMIFLLVKKAEDIRTYAWIAVMVPFIGFLVELFMAEKKWKLKIPSQLKEIISTYQIIQSVKKHLSPLLLFLMMSCAVTIYTHTDAVMLGLMKTERVVGLYYCAARIKSTLPILTGALWAAALPKAADLWKEKKTGAFQKLAEKSFHVIYMALLPLAVYFILFAESWITIIGGEDYLEAAGTTRLLLLAVIPIGFSNIIGGQMLIATGQEKKLFQAELAGAGSNILLNSILIPFFSAAGAAIATTLSETLVTIIALLAIKQQIRVRIFQPANLKRSLTGCIIAGIISFGITVFLTGALKGLLSFAIFGLTYFLVMLIMKDALWTNMLSITVKKFALRKPKKR